MKKIICVLLSSVLIVSLFFGCSKNSDETKGETETQTSSTTQTVMTPDLDLSEMSGTAVYSQVYNIMSSPENYVGKIIKIKGNFQIYEDNVQNKIFYACVIPDATACCQQGIEFVPKKKMNYPMDFPSLDTEIVVMGKFTPYIDNGDTYYTLMESTFELT